MPSGDIGRTWSGEQRKSVKFRGRTGNAIVAAAANTRHFSARVPLPSARASQAAARRADAAPPPSVINGASVGPDAARAASSASPRNSPASSAAARSSMRSPIATPPRNPPAAVQKTPKGRFWSGNSQPGRLAESTQLRRFGSCVSFRSNAPRPLTERPRVRRRNNVPRPRSPRTGRSLPRRIRDNRRKRSG